MIILIGRSRCLLKDASSRSQVLLLKYLSDKSPIVLPVRPEELLFMRELAEPLPSSAL
jgi:hypothetical protein